MEWISSPWPLGASSGRSGGLRQQARRSQGRSHLGLLLRRQVRDRRTTRTNRQTDQAHGRLQAGGGGAEGQRQAERAQPILGGLRSLQVAGPVALVDLHEQG